MLGPFLPLCRAARPARDGARRGRRRSTASRSSTSARIAERDTRPLGDRGAARRARRPHRGGASTRSTRPSIAEERGIEIVETKRTQRPRLHRPRPRHRRRRRAARRASSARSLGRRNRPHLLEAWGQRFNLQLEDHLALFRYRDLPGHDRPRRHGVRRARRQHRRRPPSATCPTATAATTAWRSWSSRPTRRSRRSVVDEIVASDGFVDGRAVSLGLIAPTRLAGMPPGEGWRSGSHALLAGGLAALAVGACGGDDDPPAGEPL